MGTETAEEPRAVIRVRGIRKAFGDKVVLDGLDLDVNKGEILVILGRSGGGKSLTLKTIVALERPDAGTVTAFHEDVLALEERELRRLRRRFGYLFQSGALINWLTSEENVALPLIENDLVPEAEVGAKVREALAMVDLPDSGPLYPEQLSGGMRKRVALARCLAQDPTCILYDEPTTGLDPMTKATIDKLIMAARDRMGVTSVVITHDITSAFRMADRIAMLHEGRIVICAPPEEVRRTDIPAVRRFLAAEPD